MFGLFKNHSAVSSNKLWEIVLHIGRGANTEMPENLAGAYVAAYVARPDYETALKEAVAQVRKLGYEFIDLEDGKVFQLDPNRWSNHVLSNWPQYASYFPSQSEVISGVSSGNVFFGPFASYEHQRAQQGVQADLAEKARPGGLT